MNVICFHNPDEENGYLSNWYYSDFSIDDVEYTSMEQYMMYQKAIRFQDISIAEEILATQDVAQIKELGRSVSGYNDNIWSGIRQIVVYEGLKAKFAQNNNLRRQLVETKTAILAECAVKDCVWGIGLSMHDPNRLNLKQWRGKNLLGYTLMMVRDGL
ncbi:MAG: NADAR family protein [Lachnospiraceae bacterium]